MADQEHLNILNQGIKVWNEWRSEFANIRPDLHGAKLTEANLTEANLQRADLTGADLTGAFMRQAHLVGAYLFEANLSRAYLLGADLTGASLNDANLSEADLSRALLNTVILGGADLTGAILGGADFHMANLNRADLTGVDLSDANLSEVYLSEAILNSAKLTWAVLVETNLEGADLTGANIYGVSAWDINLDAETKQNNLIITPPGEAEITVDELEVAQFVYLMLNNEKVRNVINTITTKTVLILGRFYEERKIVLDALRSELRNQDCLPIIFDFEPSAARNLTETVSLLARMARFVIADITDAKSIPQKLREIVPGLPSVAVQPIILDSEYEYAMFKDFLDYPWVLLPYRYQDWDALIASLEENVIAPAITKSEEIKVRRQELEKHLAEGRKID